MSELFFADRWMLWVLLPLYLVWMLSWLLLPWLAHRRRRAVAVRFSNISTLTKLRPSKTLVLRRVFEDANP